MTAKGAQEQNYETLDFYAVRKELEGEIRREVYAEYARQHTSWLGRLIFGK